MKILYFFICAFLLSSVAEAQYSNVVTPIKWTKGGFDSLFIPQTDTLAPKDKTRAWVTLKETILYRWYDTKWQPITGSASIDLSNYIQKETQNPTATLTGGETRELMASGPDISYTLNWSAGRVAATSTAQATANISSIVVGGTSQTFSNPSAGSTVSGTQAVSVVRNTNTTFTTLVTTSDGKTAMATTAINWLPKRYYGWVSDTTGLRDGSADATITALSSDLTSSRSKTWSTGSPTGTQFYVYATYSSTALTQFDMNGFPSLDALNSVSRNLTNSLGNTGTWTINWTKNGQTTSSSIVAN